MNPRAYLLKRAKDLDADLSTAGQLMTGNVLGGIGGGLAAAGSTGLLAKVLMPGLGSLAGPVSSSERKQLQKAMGVKKVPVKTLNPFKMPVEGEHFDPQAGKRGKVVISKRSPDYILAHELGHAQDPAWTSPRMMRVYDIARDVGIPLGSLAGSIWAAHGADPEDSVARTAVESALKGAAGGTVGFSPVLARETVASLRGFQGMYNAGMPWHRILRSAPGLAVGILTYIATGALPAAGAAVGTGLAARELKKEED